ncbi:MAG: hypothetical protein Q7V57_13530 [Actinomycetota bacterium]|nr:hypothetical protein [Actinomycetota bacterium]
MGVTFEKFVRGEGPRLRAALVATFGPQRGTEAVADALAYGWENWERIEPMDNRMGYLFRVAYRVALRNGPRRAPAFTAPPADELPHFEPRLMLVDDQLVIPLSPCPSDAPPATTG